MLVANREVVTLKDRPGAYYLVKRGRDNTRVAPTSNPDQSFLVASTLVDGIPVPQAATAPSNGQPEPELSDTFETLEQLTECVATKFSNGLFVTGRGGTGKTYTIKKKLEQLGMKDGRDFVEFKGYSTAAAMYNIIAANRDKLILFDDCDSILSDDTGLNILKAILDTYPVRRVSWNTNSTLIDVKEFDFTGQVIFISNKDPKTANRHLEALRTRVLTANIVGSPEQMRDRCIQLMPEIGKDLTPAQREELCDYLRENYVKINGLSLRFAVNLVSIRKFKPLGWRELALLIH